MFPFFFPFCLDRRLVVWLSMRSQLRKYHQAEIEISHSKCACVKLGIWALATKTQRFLLQLTPPFIYIFFLDSIFPHGKNPSSVLDGGWLTSFCTSIYISCCCHCRRLAPPLADQFPLRSAFSLTRPSMGWRAGGQAGGREFEWLCQASLYIPPSVLNWFRA